MKSKLTACVLATVFAAFAVACSDDDTPGTKDGAPPNDMAQVDGTTPTPDSGPGEDGTAGDSSTADSTQSGDSGPAWTNEFSIDKIILTDWSWITRINTTDGRVWFPTSPRASAQVYFADADALNSYEKVSDTTLFASAGVNRYGEQGPATEYKLKSSIQDVTFSWDDQAGFGYAPPMGLDSSIGSTAFAATDTLEFSTTGGLTESATFAAPPPLDPATFLTAGNGFANEMNLADGTFDMVIVTLLMQGGGTNGAHLLRFIKHDDMTLDNGMRKAPIMDQAALTAAAAKGYTPFEPSGAMVFETLVMTVVTHKVVDNIGPGGRSVPVYAGHTYKIEEPVIHLARE